MYVRLIGVVVMVKKSTLGELLESNSSFGRSLYATIVDTGDEYASLSSFYEKLTDVQKRLFHGFVADIQIDTISHVLGIIDGSSTLVGSDTVPMLLLDDVDTEGLLQDCFLEYIEVEVRANAVEKSLN